MKAVLAWLDPWKTCPECVSYEILPQSLQQAIDRVREQSDQEAALRYAYEILGAQYRGYRIWTFLRLDSLLMHDARKFWERRGFLHCHHLNYLLRILLVLSGHFENQDIRGYWTQIWFFSPHQYLIVTFRDGHGVEVDLWGRVYGILLGAHAHGFFGGSILGRIEE